MIEMPDFGKIFLGIRPDIRLFNENKLREFKSRGDGRRIYTIEQKKYAINLIEEHGIRGTCRIIRLPRRTLQRWCRKQNIKVQRCPDWVYERAERWKKIKEFYR